VSVESVIRSSPKRQLNRGSFAAEAAGEPGLGLIVCAEAPTVVPVIRSFAEANW